MVPTDKTAERIATRGHQAAEDTRGRRALIVVARARAHAMPVPYSETATRAIDVPAVVDPDHRSPESIVIHRYSGIPTCLTTVIR